MPQTIEDFVAKLKTDGVEAGQAAAEQLRAEGKAQAADVIEQAKAQAEKIVSDAEAQAQSILAKGRNELKLAARDAVLRLRETIAAALRAVLRGPVEQQLLSAEFLAPMLHDLIRQYARADCERASTITINLPPEQCAQLATWAIGELGRTAHTRDANVQLKSPQGEYADKAAGSEEGDFVSIDLKGMLAEAGFEYRVTGATVEVTVDSVVDTLSELVGGRVRELLDEAMKEAQPQ